MDEISWKCTFFSALTPYELYAVMKLRNEVFVVEQNCIFQDADNKDQKCYHLMGYIQDELVAYARIVPSGVTFIQVSIGRVITSPKFRCSGFGKKLMQQAIQQCELLFGKQEIKIGAQLYLKRSMKALDLSKAAKCTWKMKFLI